MSTASDILTEAKKRRAELAAEIDQLDRMIAAAEGRSTEPVRLVPLPAPCPWPHYPPATVPLYRPTIVPMQPLDQPPFGPVEPFPFGVRITCCGDIPPAMTPWAGRGILQ